MDFKLIPVNHKKVSCEVRFFEGDDSYEIIQRLKRHGKNPKDVISYLLKKIEFPKK